jgi:hypothetical protein
MEYIPAIHAAKVGMRYPARVAAVGDHNLLLLLDLTMIAPGRNPSIFAQLDTRRTMAAQVARALRDGDQVEVALIDVHHLGLVASASASLPADPAWLTWNNGTVRQLAHRIRESGETVLLPVLADALEEAGCTEQVLLARCRNPDNDDLTWLVELLATQE